MKLNWKRIFRNFLIGIVGLIAALFIIYLFGPKPPKPVFTQPEFKNTLSLSELENKINTDENNVPHIKPECHARIVWNDTLHKEKTKYALLYLHGLSASRYEGSPVNEDVAKSMNANLFEARLSEHGIENGDSNLVNFTADKFYESGEAALNIAKQLGDSVIVIGTSAGGALSLFLASRHPEIKSIVLYSPAVQLFDPNASKLSEPWGFQIIKAITGKPFNGWKFKNPKQVNYWVNHYSWQAVVELQNFIKYAMTPETFKNIKCPVFLGYYYENQEHQDKVVSVAAMKKMYDELGTTANLKKQISFTNAHEHVIACDLVSDDWQRVEHETEVFLSGITVK